MVVVVVVVVVVVIVVLILVLVLVLVVVVVSFVALFFCAATFFRFRSSSRRPPCSSLDMWLADIVTVDFVSFFR